MLIWIKPGTPLPAILNNSFVLNDASNDMRVLIDVRGKYEKECCSLRHRAAARRRIRSEGQCRSDHFRQALLAERSPRLAWPDP